MNLKFYNESFSGAVRQRNLFLLTTLTSLALNVILGFAILHINQQVVIIPANLDQKLNYSNRHVDNQYLEMMSKYFISQLLEKTSSNIRQKHHTLLQYVSGSSYQKIANHLAEEESKYIELNLSTHFEIKEMFVNVDKMTATIKGIIHSYFGKSGSSKDLANYQITYEFNNGRLLLCGFTKIEAPK